MFDVPRSERARMEWRIDLPIEDRPWNVGLIVGPSGSGKSTIARKVWGDLVDRPLTWKGASVIDDFAPSMSMSQIAEICQAVGFNTIPAWLRPFPVLSNGEKFRVELARRLSEHGGEVVVVDEFTSVVDRQVAKIGAHAVQKYTRKHGRQFVAVTCHYDVVDWLQPDWVLEPGVNRFEWRAVQRRPSIDVTISPVPYAAWQLFAPFHYLTNDLHRAARCFVLFVGDQPAAFAGMLHRPHPKVKDVIGISRLVTLPDFQGLGLAFVLSDTLGAMYKAVGKRFHMYPAHPSLIRSFDKSPMWVMTGKPGRVSSPNATAHGGPSLNRAAVRQAGRSGGAFGGRPNATFEYVGPTMPIADATRLLAFHAKP